VETLRSWFNGQDIECPYCGSPINAHAEAKRAGGSRPPRPGDASLCSHCKGFAIYEATDPFGTSLALRPPTKSEAGDIAALYPGVVGAVLPEVKARLRAAGIYIEQPHERD
jgi:hypothetical protein